MSLYADQSGGPFGLDVGAGVLADLLRVPVPYLLEVWDHGSLAAAVALPLPPDSLQIERAAATTVEYTLTGAPERHHLPNRAVHLVLEGSSGRAARSGHTRSGLLTYADGPTLVQEFDRFLEAYQKRAARAQALALADADGFRRHHGAVWLVFRSLPDDLHLRVEIQSWDRTRDHTSKTGLSRWRLGLHGYAPDAERAPGNFLGGVADAAQDLTAAIDALNVYASLVPLLLSNVRADLDVLRGPLLALRRTTAILSQATAAAASVLDVPRLLLSDAAFVVEGAAQAWDATLRLAPEALDGLSEQWDRLGGLLAVEALAAQVASAVGRVGGTVADTGGGAVPWAPPAVGVPVATSPPRLGAWVQVPVGPGTLAELVATWAGPDPALLARVLWLNGLAAPDRWSDGAPLRPDDRILIPAPEGLELPQGAPPLGRDLLLTADGDLALAADGVDVAVVEGPQALSQALGLRLRASAGDLPWADYGIALRAGDSAADLGYVSAHLRAQLVQDPRVASVDSVTLEREGDRVTLRAVIATIAGRAGLTIPWR